MTHLLKAMGFWIWGLIAIALSVSVISVNSRVMQLFRGHDVSATTPRDRSVAFDAAISQGSERQLDKNALATGAANAIDMNSATNTNSTTRTQFSISAQLQEYQKVIDYGKQMSDGGTATANDLLIVAQSYFQLKDCKNTGVWADKAIAASRKAGEAPKENLFLFKLQCASDASDNAAMLPVLYDLIRLNNKSTYWNTLLRIERQDERDDHNTLMIYRIMFDTSSMNAGSDYIEMAQLLGDAALPAEAQTVLEKAMSAGLIKDEQKERTTRLLNSFKTRADADKKGLAALDAEATKNPAGELDVKLGEVYYGTGDYQNAVTALNRGIQKGQVKHLDEAYVYLGRASFALGDDLGARDALIHLREVADISPRVLNLWQLHAETVRAAALSAATAAVAR